MASKLQKSSRSLSRAKTLIKEVQKLKAKRVQKKERIIGPKQYRQQLKKQLQENHITTNIIPRTSTSKLTRKSSKLYIQSLGLDKVSIQPIEQQPTPLDDYQRPIIKIGEIQIPEMEVIMDDIPTVKFPTLENKRLTTKSIKKSIKKVLNTEYIIAIPSYNRPDLIQIKTLALLNQHKINPDIIHIFVANQEQYDTYTKKVPNFLYGKIIIGELGLKNQRNFIMNYYPEGTQIVQMDDDLDKIMELVSSSFSRIKKTRKTQKTLRRIDDLDGFIKRAFEMCYEKGIYLWGVYPLANSRFMTSNITTDLRFIVGPFWGVINRHLPELQITIDEKENAERTLQHYTIDHAVLRFNNVGIETRYYKNKGGMQDEGKNRKEEALKSVYYLHQKYPKLTKIYLAKKSGVPEIRMIRETKNRK
jgi:hypothetical protein